MNQLSFDEIKEQLLKDTNKDEKYITSFLYTIQSKGFKEGSFAKTIEAWDSMGDIERSDLAVKFAGTYFVAMFHFMMNYLTDKKVESEKKETTEIVFILDKSGSMHGIKNDAIGGFNAFLEEQKKADGDTKMTVILFDHNIDVLVDGEDINKVAELNDVTYKPIGGTALLDAIGMGIDSLNKRISEMSPDEQPSKFIFAIMTDGEENSSRQYGSKQIKNKIQNMTNQKEYQFIFLGANIDAVETAGNLGIRADFAGQFVAKGDGGSKAMLHANEMVMSYRSMGTMSSYVDASIKVDGLKSTDIKAGDLSAIAKKTSLDITKALKKVSENASDKGE